MVQGVFVGKAYSESVSVGGSADSFVGYGSVGCSSGGFSGSSGLTCMLCSCMVL